MRVLDVGCGTGAISRGIAEIVGPSGYVHGIDNTLDFIELGKASTKDLQNLVLKHADLYGFNPGEEFDLVVSARTLQWLSDPYRAIEKMKSFLKPGGVLSILDYIHEDISWEPAIPESMASFYSSWLRWRRESGMHNRVAEELPNFFESAGFSNIEVHKSNEYYSRQHPLFQEKLKIWNKVASSKQLVDEGYVSESLRVQAISEYSNWIENEAKSMEMVLWEVRGVNI